MNRKQKRDGLRATRGLGNNVQPGQCSRSLRKIIFGGNFGDDFRAYFDKKAHALKVAQ